ncbi:MAG: hypothetical protein PVH40_03565 [Gemmatimonadales bacterium]|jgi:hypothetical protein
MVSLLSLWLPILLSAVFVFVVSSIIHMFLPYHRSDFGPVPDEDGVRDALGKFKIPPGDYVIPYAGGAEAMRSPEFRDKTEEGPVAFMTVLPNGQPSMVGSLALWFAYCLVVGVFAAYITSRAVVPGDPYLTVFRFAGASAFMGYGLALLQNSIWYKRNWMATLKSMFDALIYALCTAGVFGWLWPS